MVWFVPENVPLPANFIGCDPSSPGVPAGFSSYQRHLPHWRIPGSCYFTTFRMGDSIPETVLSEMKRELEDWDRRLHEASLRNRGTLPLEEMEAWRRFQRNHLRKLEQILDQGLGECLLRDPDHRQIVVDALRHFDGTRCDMFAFTVMPNHVHVLCRPLDDHELEDLCRSWKWYSTWRIQRRRGKRGGLWQQENFDRVIRDGEHYAKVVRYIANNPLAAKLRDDEAAVWLCEEICEANPRT